MKKTRCVDSEELEVLKRERDRLQKLLSKVRSKINVTRLGPCSNPRLNEALYKYVIIKFCGPQDAATRFGISLSTVKSRLCVEFQKRHQNIGRYTLRRYSGIPTLAQMRLIEHTNELEPSMIDAPEGWSKFSKVRLLAEFDRFKKKHLALCDGQPTNL